MNSDLKILCTYPATYGNRCYRPGLPEQGGRCLLHSNLPKSKEQIAAGKMDSPGLEGVVISRMDLTHMDLSGSFMRYFTALRCDFSYSDLHHSEMQGATFDGCNFVQANLQEVFAQGARFINCVLSQADLSDANLTSAILLKSSFRQANLQRVKIGFDGMILYPGAGNYKQYYTQIEGSDFDGADLRDAQIDPMYRDAPNLQEPLRRVWLYSVKGQFDVVIGARTNKEKKDSLESLAGTLLEGISGLSVYAKDKRRTTSEIDLIVRNRSVVLATAGLSGPIFVECRNVSQPVGAKSIRDFAGKLPPDGVGIVITTNRLTRDAEKAMKDQIQQHISHRIRLLFWDRPDLESIVSGQSAPEDLFIERYYHVLSL